MKKYSRVVLSLITIGFLAFLIWPRITSPNNTINTFDGVGALNGVYYIYDPDAKDYSADLIIHFGEAQNDSLPGLPHYLEHLVYHHAQSDATALSKSDSNAETSFLTTSYFENGEDIAPIFTYLSRVFERPEIDRDKAIGEIKVVEQERIYRAPQTPNEQYYLDQFARVFNDTKLGALPIGTKESIAKFTPELAYELHNKYYDPVNADLVVFGSMKPRKMRKLIEDYFADIPSDPSKKIEQPQPVASPARLTFELDGNDDALWANYALTDSGLSRTQLGFAAEVIYTMSLSNKEGGLARRLVFDDNYANALGNDYEFFPDSNALVLLLNADWHLDGAQDIWLDEEFERWVAALDGQKDFVNGVMQNLIDDIEESPTKPDEIYDFAVYSLSNGPSVVVNDAQYLDAAKAMRAEDIIDLLDKLVNDARISSYRIHSNKGDDQ